MFSTKDLTYSALMMYVVFPLKNGKLGDIDDLTKRLTELKSQKYTAIKVLASAASNQLYKKNSSMLDLVSKGVLTSSLVVAGEYLLVDDRPDKSIFDYQTTFLLHTLGAVANEKLPINHKKLL